MTGGSSTELFENNDILFEILLRVNPESVFRCILVSKPWLKLITSLSFREDYIKRWDWKGFDIKFVGFSYYFTGHVKHPCEFPAPPAVQLVPTSELGSVINRSKSLCHAGYFIASTPDGLILSGEHPQKYFVCSLTTRQHFELPPIPKHYKDVCMAILSHEDNMVFDNCRKMRNFEVIYAKSTYMEEPDDDIVPIQTFSSLTGEWRPSILYCTQYFALGRGVGTVAKGVVYWSVRIGLLTACFAAYDTKKTCVDGIGRIALINKPFTVHDAGAGKDHRCTLGVTSEGRLMYASLPTLRQICIWVLDDDNFEDASCTIDDDSRWRLSYEINIDSMMIRNSAVLSGCGIKFRDVLDKLFKFVAFFPGETDSVFLRCEEHIFIYQRDSQKLERITPYNLEEDSSSEPWNRYWNRYRGWPQPVTLSEAWPSWVRTGE